VKEKAVSRRERVEEQFGGRIRARKEMEHMNMTSGKELEAKAHIGSHSASRRIEAYEAEREPDAPKKSTNYRF
jgi:hypothetical protein